MVASSERLVHGLLRRAHQALFVPRPPAFFDADWYAAQYPDVAAAVIDPWLHFHFHGCDEGRLANRRHLALWFSDATFRQVAQEFHREADALARRDREYLGWLLARRLAWNGQWEDVIELRSQFGPDFGLVRRSKSGFGHMPAVLFVDALQKSGAECEARRTLDRLKDECGEMTEIALLEANHVHTFGDASLRAADWLRVVNQIYQAGGLQPIDLRSGVKFGLDALTSPHAGLQDANQDSRPLVSVLMAAFNAEGTIEQAISSVLAQSWTNFELIVVDDGSTDATAERVEQIAADDDRVRLLRTQRRGGPYAARNQALAAARGEFITLHDADDWSHPQKIELQVCALLDEPRLIATFSDWARVSSDLVFGTWRMPSAWLGWCHRNTSSFMFRHAVHERLGFWDEVKCNGDVEFVDRVMAVWGPSAVRSVMPGVPLALARLDDASLTQQSETHVITSLKGLRHDYALAYSAWHAGAGSADELYMPSAPGNRPFPVPAAILPS